MNRYTVELIRAIPWSLISKQPRFGHANTYYGVFPSWQAALAAIPSGLPVGYDHDQFRAMFLSYPPTLVRPSDYAVILHLSKILREGIRVVDVGGGIGSAFYTAAKYLQMPTALEWLIHDLPVILEASREVALREGAIGKPIRFRSNLTEAGRCDVFFSSGSLQLIEEKLPSLLERLPSLPNHILINRIPVWDEHEIVTLNDMNFSLSPYRIFNRLDFVSSLEKLGYRLKDDWSCPESQCSVRFRRKMRVKAFSGCYFRLES